VNRGFLLGLVAALLLAEASTSAARAQCGVVDCPHHVHLPRVDAPPSDPLAAACEGLQPRSVLANGSFEQDAAGSWFFSEPAVRIMERVARTGGRSAWLSGFASSSPVLRLWSTGYPAGSIQALRLRYWLLVDRAAGAPAEDYFEAAVIRCGTPGRCERREGTRAVSVRFTVERADRWQLHERVWDLRDALQYAQFLGVEMSLERGGGVPSGVFVDDVELEACLTPPVVSGRKAVPSRVAAAGRVPALP
jgi:hypothetical protein